MHKTFAFRTALVLLLTACVIVLSSCGEKVTSIVPPLPTLADETPSPEPEHSAVPTPTATPKPTAAPTPPPEATAAPTPVPTPTAAPDPDMPYLTIREETLPEDMIRYNVADLHGWISTDKGLITMVWGMLLDSGGNIVQECTYTPYEQSFSLAGTVNADLQFAYLEPDAYTYQVFAVAENKGLVNEQTLIDHSFTIFGSESEMRSASRQEEIYSSKLTQDVSQSGQVWNYLTRDLGNPYAVAAILSNIYIESGCCPTRVQGDFSDKFSFSQDYTEKVDAGIISREAFIHSLPGDSYGVGYGLCQWSGDRKAALYDLAKEKNCSVGDLATQCEFIIKELSEDYPELYEYLKETDNVKEASSRFCFEYEQAAEGRKDNTYNDYLDQYAS